MSGMDGDRAAALTDLGGDPAKSTYCKSFSGLAGAFGCNHALEMDLKGVVRGSPWEHRCLKIHLCGVSAQLLQVELLLFWAW